MLNQLKHYKEVFVCRDNRHSGEELILKVEIIDENQVNRLETEWQLLKRLSTTECFKFVVDFLADSRFRYLLMKPLGQNLFEFWKQKLKQNEWHLETVVRYADQMISRIANCHVRNVLHRDIKPENFVVDSNDNSFLYLIDFNLGKLFSSPSVPHIPYRVRSPQYSVGNVQFLSVNVHKGVEQSRRDDLISIGYSLIYLAKGSLPWSGMRSRDFDCRLDYLLVVGEKKYNCSLQEVCDGLPVQFQRYMNYCSQLKFDEKPDYFLLRDMFKDLLCQLKSSKVSLIRFQPNIESNTINQSKEVPPKPKPKDKFSERIKRLSCSPQIICP